MLSASEPGTRRSDRLAWRCVILTARPSSADAHVFDRELVSPIPLAADAVETTCRLQMRAAGGDRDPCDRGVPSDADLRADYYLGKEVRRAGVPGIRRLKLLEEENRRPACPRD